MGTCLVQRRDKAVDAHEDVVIRLKCEFEADVLRGPAVEGRRLSAERIVALFNGQIL